MGRSLAPLALWLCDLWAILIPALAPYVLRTRRAQRDRIPLRATLGAVHPVGHFENIPQIAFLMTLVEGPTLSPIAGQQETATLQGRRQHRRSQLVDSPLER